MESKLPSNKKFGLLFCFIFLIIGFYFYLYSFSQKLIIAAFIISLIFFSISILKPSLLKYLNFIWFQFSLILSKIINPIILGIIFFFVITPFALIAKIFGRDILKIKKGTKGSYWIKKESDEYSKESFRKQF